MKKLKVFNEAQLTVIDKLGAEGLLSMREKQVGWGRLIPGGFSANGITFLANYH